MSFLCLVVGGDLVFAGCLMIGYWLGQVGSAAPLPPDADYATYAAARRQEGR